MSETLEFIPFHSPQDAGWDEAWTLYETAFPQNERRLLDDHIRLLKENPHFVADGIWLKGQFVGLIYHWEVGTYQFVEFLAVKETFRSMNIGSRIMQSLLSRYPKVILEIEPPVDTLTRRRLAFYERLGFVVNDYEYYHPSYEEPQQPYPLVVLSNPKPLTQKEASEFADFVRLETLKYSKVIHPKVPFIPAP